MHKLIWIGNKVFVIHISKFLWAAQLDIKKRQLLYVQMSMMMMLVVVLPDLLCQWRRRRDDALALIVRRSNGTENNIFSSRKRRAWVHLADQSCFWREARSTSGHVQNLEPIYIASVQREQLFFGSVQREQLFFGCPSLGGTDLLVYLLLSQKLT